MNDPRGLFAGKAIVFIAVVVPLALAEGIWWYLAASVLAVAVGWWRLARGHRPLLGPLASRAFVLAAFGLLLAEYLSLICIPVVVLSHFMTLVCATKFLQARTLRDDAQLAVLCLLLLVVAAIVSGNIVFLLVLVIYLSVGLDLLVRFHLGVERAHVQRANLAIPAAGGAGETDTPPVRATGGVTLLMSLTALAVGVLVFAFFPRIGMGMFGRPDVRGGGLATTGSSPRIDFDSIGPIAEAERQMMRVVVEATGGPAPDAETALYLRGQVFDFYAAGGFSGRGREWQSYQSSRTRNWEFREAEEGELSLLPDYDGLESEHVLIQRYTVEPGAINEPVLFALYPPVAFGGVGSEDTGELIKSLDDQTLHTASSAPRLRRYTVKSAVGLTPGVVRALRAERAAAGVREPRAHPPDPRLADEPRIRGLITPLLEQVGPLDVPANREEFARLVADWLRSGEYKYTLSPPPPRPGVDPVSDFLLRHKQGYCQHFASAMAVMCQLAGVPAHLVTGFRCDTYNSMGRFWSVRGKHAHAWVEVYISGRGWVPFDPTPALTQTRADVNAWLQKLRLCGDYLQFQWANLVLTYDADARRSLLDRFEGWLLRPARSESTLYGKVAAFVYELFAWRLQMSWQDRLLYWVFALLIVALTVLIGYVVVVVSWRGGNRLAQSILARRAGTGKMGDAVFYHRLCRRLSALGLRRRPEQTPAEFAADLAARYPVLRPAAELVSAYYEVVYGRHGLTPERREEFDRFLREIDGVDRAALQTP